VKKNFISKFSNFNLTKNGKKGKKRRAQIIFNYHTLLMGPPTQHIFVLTLFLYSLFLIWKKIVMLMMIDFVLWF